MFRDFCHQFMKFLLFPFSCLKHIFVSEQLLSHREVLETKDRELISLQERLRARELEVTRIREEEMQRAQILQTAVMNYVGRAPPTVS
jgi:hypothetical protein